MQEALTIIQHTLPPQPTHPVFQRVVWFRHDLRISDNPALFHGAMAGDGVLAAYVLCDEMIKRHSVAPVRVDFIRRNLLALRESLAALNIPLLVLPASQMADISPLMECLMRQTGASDLYFNAEYPLDEQRRDHSVTTTLLRAGYGVAQFHDRLIVPPGQIRNGKGEPYKVFTAYKNSWVTRAKQLPLQPLGKPKVQPEQSAVAQSEAQLDALFARHAQRDLASVWPAGEAMARRRLVAFLATRVQQYASARDIPSLAGTSQLSPYLALGVISPRECLRHAVQASEGAWLAGEHGIATWINELIWREFYQQLVVDFPAVCKWQPMQAYTNAFPWRRDASLFQAWCAGETGVPIVDAAMRQLLDLGWMHNRLRMVVASYLTKNLQIDWRMGEAYFMSQLIDGDFAANNGGWQWCASTGTDAAPWFRVFNPVRQSQRFDPDGVFIRQYLPVLAGLSAKNIHSPPPIKGYPAPLVDLAVSRKQTIEMFGALAR